MRTRALQHWSKDRRHAPLGDFEETYVSINSISFKSSKGQHGKLKSRLRLDIPLNPEPITPHLSSSQAAFTMAPLEKQGAFVQLLWEGSHPYLCPDAISAPQR